MTHTPHPGEKIRLMRPYVSQRSDTARRSANDCGPACVAMKLNEVHQHPTVDQIYQETGLGGSGAISVKTLQQMARFYGQTLLRRDAYTHTSDAGELFGWLRDGKAAILLIDYKPVMKANLHETRIDGVLHFVLAVGFDDKHFFVHDPYWLNNRGAFRRWPHQVLFDAWLPQGAIALI